MDFIRRTKLVLLLALILTIIFSTSAYASTTITLNDGSTKWSGQNGYYYFYNKIRLNKPFRVTDLSYQGKGWAAGTPKIFSSEGTLLASGRPLNITLEANVDYWVGFEAIRNYHPGEVGGEFEALYSSRTTPYTVESTPTGIVATVLGRNSEYNRDGINNYIPTGVYGGAFNIILTGYNMPNVPIPSAPANNSYTGDNTPTFSATVSDPEGENCRVEFQYSKVSNMSSGILTITSNYVANGATASATPSTSLTAGQWYWRAKAIKANGMESFWSEIYTFNIDPIKPTGSININNGATYTISTSVSLQITGSDADSGIDQMRFSNNGTTWGSWVSYAPTYSYVLDSTNGAKTVYMQLKDKAGNISDTYTDSIILDTVAPTGAISINNGADYTNNVNVTLNISYSDAISGPYQMQISTSSDFSGASWINVNNIANITLTAGDGTNTIYARFKDYAGNISSGVSDTIILDRVNPTGSITVLSEDGLTKTSSTKVILTITGSDDRSGLAGIQLSNNGVNWGPLETLTSPREWNVSVGAGTKTVYLKLIDNAGNEYVVSDDIYLVDDVIGPTVTLLINGGATSTTNKLVTLNISAFDNFSKLNEMQMRFSNNGYLWSAWEPFSDIKENWDITNAAYGGTDSAGTKSIYVQVLDAAQNTGLARADIGYSTQTPTGTVSLNMGIPGTFNGEEVRFVSNANINLSLNFSNVTEMRVSMDGVSYSPWIPYESTLPITLPKGDGLTVVGVQVRNINKVISDTIKYKVVMDTTPPNIFVKTSNGATATKTGSIELTILVTDNISIDSFKYKINDGSWNSLPSNGKITVSGLAEGFHQIQVSVMDQAGNISKQTINVWSL